MEMPSNKKAVVYRMVMGKHICPYGLKSLDLLKSQGYEVEDHHLTSREATDQFKEKHGVKTTPQTFIDDKRVGGYDDLKEFFGKKQEGKLLSFLLRSVCALWPSKSCETLKHSVYNF